jgi:hypothetical protein
MTDFLDSLKADLLDRRLLPILALVVAGLVAAVAYNVLDGGSSGTPVASTGGPAVTPAVTPGIAVSQPTTANQAVAETTSGVSDQRGGVTRNPFTPLPAPPSATKAATTTTVAGSSSPSSSSGSSTKTSSPAPAPATPKASTPAKPKTVYQVSVLFGLAAPGTPTQSAQLTPYERLTRQQPLPAKSPIVVFRGVTAGGKSAAFTLVGEAILHGNAKCLPNPSQCEVIDLKEGQTEELEFLPPNGAAVTYRLQVVTITSSLASAAVARVAFRRESRAGRELLRRIGRGAIPYLHYSPLNGVLAFAARPRRAAGAHVALHGQLRKR